MGISKSLANKFLKSPYYNPQETTLLVGALENLKGVKGRDIFIKSASLVDEPTVALFMRLRAQMMDAYNSNVTPVERFLDLNGTVLLKNRKGKIVGLFPLDHLAWTELLRHKEMAASESIRDDLGIKGKELWIQGTVGSVAKSSLEANGWRVEENVGKRLEKK